MPREYQFPFELRHLVYFREVARHLHFRKAAEALSIAQPALSRQIAQLEAALGVRLLNRSSRRVELTPAGTAFLERTEPVLAALLQVPSDMKAVSEGRVGRLRVAFTGLAMATVLPDILRGFHKKFPGIRLELNESPTAQQIAALKAGDIDCGFFHPDGQTQGIETTLLLREKNGVLLPADHPLRTRKTVRLKDLATTPFVLFPRANNPGFYDRVLSAFASSGVAPRIAEEVWPRSNGVGLVRAGVGATIVSPSEAKHIPDEVIFRKLSGPAPTSTVVIGWRSEPEPQPALAAFLRTAALNVGV
ncbi:MAG TPA: LysR family transcriptional regulator [Opitutaceae bacterium]|jgi:DNA-binding transcriptional LysR family regulator|nr:LysR family transcriptional regulator [Opitutaceae bacterium]